MLRLLLFVILTRTASSLFDTQLNDMYLTLPRKEFVKHFNKQNHTWKMAEKPHNVSFPGCIFPDADELRKTLPTKHHSFEDILNAPDSFDARAQWSQCDSISQIFNQGDCGSCWTFGTAMTASDRTCIHTGVQVNLSEQDLECFKPGVCYGGSHVDAMNFWKSNGLVTQACKPYDIDKLRQNTCTKTCVDGSIDYNGNKYYGREVYNVPTDIESIKAELSQNGPVAAQMACYTDLQADYHGGIYEHKFGSYVSDHCVRVVGYGVENGVSYWLVANSWGTGWGESGLFRVKQGEADLHMENYIVSGR